MNKIIKIILLIIIAGGLLSISYKTNAATNQTNNSPANCISSSSSNTTSVKCDAPYYIPSNCPNDYVPDLQCINTRLFNPGILCCPNKCNNAPSNVCDTVYQTYFSQFDIFGTTFKINPNNLPTIINLFITTILGLISIYALLRGIYVAGIKRTQAISPEDIANLNKELTNLVIGFIIAWGFIIIIQIVANILGVGSLSNIDINGGKSGGLVVTIN